MTMMNMNTPPAVRQLVTHLSETGYDNVFYRRSSSPIFSGDSWWDVGVIKNGYEATVSVDTSLPKSQEFLPLADKCLKEALSMVDRVTR